MEQVSMMYEIKTSERKYINSEDSSVKVSFQLPGRDWSELSQLPQWKAVENFLSQKKSIEDAIEKENELREILNHIAEQK